MKEEILVTGVAGFVGFYLSKLLIKKEKDKMYRIKRLITNPKIIIFYLNGKGLLKFLPDKVLLKIMFFLRLNKKLDLINPKSFNEKLQWLKLYDRNPLYTQLVDKYEVRKYISEQIGEEYLIPLIGVWDKFDDIDFSKLPNEFVLKCTHDSGGIVICKDKSKLNIEKTRKKFEKLLKTNYYYVGREWPYKNVKPRIICEKLMVDESGTELKDYKIFCFNGNPKLIQVDYGRFTEHKRNFYDLNWEYKPVSVQYPTDPTVSIRKPDKLEKMLDLASILSKDYPHIRIDFYSINGNIYFGEMTFYHGGGYENFYPKEFEEEMGNWIDLDMLKINVKSH